MRKKTRKVVWKVGDFLSVCGVSSQFIGRDLLESFEQMNDIRTMWKINSEAEWINWSGQRLGKEQSLEPVTYKNSWGSALRG